MGNIYDELANFVSIAQFLDEIGYHDESIVLDEKIASLIEQTVMVKTSGIGRTVMKDLGKGVLETVDLIKNLFKIQKFEENPLVKRRLEQLINERPLMREIANQTPQAMKNVNPVGWGLKQRVPQPILEQPISTPLTNKAALTLDELLSQNWGMDRAGNPIRGSKSKLLDFD
jgi:hypothetical protein